MMRLHHWALTFLAVAAMPLRAQANRRSPEPEMIPNVLVKTVPTLFGFGDTVRFSVGRPREDWPAALMPGSTATVIGGSTLGPFRSIVVSYPRATDVLASFGAILTRAGYHPGDTASVMPVDGGFSSFSALRSSKPPGSATWCGDSSRAVSIAPIDSTATRRRFVVELITLKGSMSYSGCPGRSSRMPRMGRMGPELALKVPPLPAPAGARVKSSGMSSSGNSFNMRAETDTALSTAALVQHYGAALTRAGWTRQGDPVVSGGIAVMPLAARDSAGVEWHGAMIILTAGARRSVNLWMAQNAEDQDPFN